MGKLRLFAHAEFAPRVVSLGILVVLLFSWHVATLKPTFKAGGLSEEQLMNLEFKGDIVRDERGDYIFNPEKARGLPGPMAVFHKSIEEFSNAFKKKGTNDHGIAYLVQYTVSRFAVGFVSASILATLVGVTIGLSPLLYRALNPFIQLLKPISPLAWMPLLLYSVQDPTWTAICVVFLASLWPTIANTAFGVSSIRQDYMRVASLLQLSWFRRLITVILPAAAPAIVAGLRISFGSALVAVVPAEMLLGELGVGYLTWIEWNNLNISGVIFAIMIVGFVGVILDFGFNRLAKLVNYAD